MTQQSDLDQIRDLIERDPKAAIVRLRDETSTSPEDWHKRLLLARALRAIGDDRQAAIAERAAISAATNSPRHREAAQLLQRGHAYEANSLLKTLIDENPDDVLANVMFGIQASRANQFELAEDHLGRAVLLAPGDPGTRLAFADHLFRSKRFAAAMDELAALPVADRDSEAAQTLLADCLGETGEVTKQLELLQQLVEKSRNPIAYLIRIGLAQRTLGKLQDAAATFREVLAAAPYDGTTWYNLANLKVERFSHADIARMREGLEQAGAPPENKIRLSFALGTAFEVAKEWENSFAYYDQGNRLRESITPYDPALVTDWVDKNERSFRADFFARRSQANNQLAGPIFIVGLQRSGSTLLEQILASNSMIEGTAELNDIPNMVRALSEEAAARGTSFEDLLANMSADRLAALGQSYIDSTQLFRRTRKPYFTDKMPNNWMHLALIRSILPDAFVVDIRRNPMDCCFSNWKQLYARGLDHSNRLETMGKFYADYVRQMRHFDRVQPGWVHRIIYEELVADPELEIRRLLDYLDIEFQPAMLEFHLTERTVQTISAGQVRQPLNRKGIGQWEHFKPWLGPLEDEIGDLASDWKF